MQFARYVSLCVIMHHGNVNAEHLKRSQQKQLSPGGTGSRYFWVDNSGFGLWRHMEILPLLLQLCAAWKTAAKPREIQIPNRVHFSENNSSTYSDIDYSPPTNGMVPQAYLSTSYLAWCCVPLGICPHTMHILVAKSLPTTSSYITYKSRYYLD